MLSVLNSCYRRNQQASLQFECQTSTSSERAESSLFMRKVPDHVTERCSHIGCLSTSTLALSRAAHSECLSPRFSVLDRGVKVNNISRGFYEPSVACYRVTFCVPENLSKWHVAYMKCHVAHTTIGKLSPFCIQMLSNMVYQLYTTSFATHIPKLNAFVSLLHMFLLMFPQANWLHPVPLKPVFCWNLQLFL